MSPALPVVRITRQPAPRRRTLNVKIYDALAAKLGYDTLTAQAALHGIDRSTLHYIKSGSHIPRLDTAMRMAADLGVKVEELWP